MKMGCLDGESKERWDRRLPRAAACAMNCMDQSARWWEPPAVPVFHKTLANNGNRPLKPPKMLQNGAEMVPNFVGDRGEGHNRLGAGGKGQRLRYAIFRAVDVP